jgi:transcriptional regulator with XRE-family HTH domain
MKRVNPKDREIGQRIRLQRMETGLSQTDLGHSVGVTFQQIQKYEKGANRVSGSRITQIATVLNVPPSFFFGETPNGNGAKPNGAAALVEAALTEPGTYKMMRSYNKLNPRVRHAVAHLLNALAREDDDE